MSYVVKLVSVGQPGWVWPWPTIDDGITDPPRDEQYSHNTVTGRNYFYHQVSGADDGFYNCWFNRVPQWTPYTAGTDPTLSTINITPGSLTGLIGEPMAVAPNGNADWTVLSNTITEAGNRNGYAAGPSYERNLPSVNPTSYNASEQNYTYERVIQLQSTIDGAAIVTLTYQFSVLGTETLRHSNAAYLAFVHKYKWVFQDESGTTEGGFISHYGDLPVAGAFGSATVATVVRLTEREFGSVNHLGFPFLAYEYTTDRIDLAGQTSTTADGVTPLEIGGQMFGPIAWIQPPNGAGYFPFNFDNADSGTALYDPSTGRRTTDKPLPMQMQFPA